MRLVYVLYIVHPWIYILENGLLSVGVAHAVWQHFSAEDKCYEIPSKLFRERTSMLCSIFCRHICLPHFTVCPPYCWYLLQQALIFISFFKNVICSCRRCSSCFLILISKRKTIGAESSGIILPECHILLKIQKKPRNSIQFLLHIFIIVFKFADHFYQA